MSKTSPIPFLVCLFLVYLFVVFHLLVSFFVNFFVLSWSVACSRAIMHTSVTLHNMAVLGDAITTFVVNGIIVHVVLLIAAIVF